MCVIGGQSLRAYETFLVRVLWERFELRHNGRCDSGSRRDDRLKNQRAGRVRAVRLSVDPNPSVRRFEPESNPSFLSIERFALLVLLSRDVVRHLQTQGRQIHCRYRSRPSPRTLSILSACSILFWLFFLGSFFL